MTDLSKVKETIRQLLNLAENDAAAELEAENALRFARRLMLRHNIDQADLEAPRDPHEIAADAETVNYDQQGAYSHRGFIAAWEKRLAWAIDQLVGTVNHYYEGGTQLRRNVRGTLEYDAKGMPRKGRRIVFYGPKGDVRDSVELFDEWSQTIIAMARLRYGGIVKGPGRSYAEGFAAALYAKVRKIHGEERRAIADERDRSTALMLYNAHAIMQAKRQRAEGWLKEQGIRLRTVSSSSAGHHHGEAYTAGRSDGTKASFRRQRTPRLEG